VCEVCDMWRAVVCSYLLSTYDIDFGQNLMLICTSVMGPDIS
jgi:hypothetical protein